MAVMDEFKEQRQSLKDKPLKQKFRYFLDYYKWFVIIGVLAAVMIFVLVRDIVTAKDDAFYGIFVNAFSTSEEASKAFLDGYAEYAGIDQNESQVIIDATLRMGGQADQSTMSTTQLLMVYTAAQDLDVLSMDSENYKRYANNEYMMDLSTCLTSDQLAQYKDDLYYVDLAVIESIDDTRLATDETYVVNYPDPTKPEEMERPVAVGINLKASAKFSETYMYAYDDAYIGILSNTAQPANSLKFLEYLFFN